MLACSRSISSACSATWPSSDASHFVIASAFSEATRRRKLKVLLDAPPELSPPPFGATMGRSRMSNQGDGNSVTKAPSSSLAVAPAAAPSVPADRASESVVSDFGADGIGAPPKRTSAISSGPFEISRESFSSPPRESYEPAHGPPSAVIANAMSRGQKGLPLSTIVWIGGGVVVVLLGLALLLFR
jgi:hypothetical protein